MEEDSDSPKTSSNVVSSRLWMMFDKVKL